MMKDTVIFDLDGTLALIDHRRHHVECEREKQDWDAFYDACDKDEPNAAVISLLQMCREQGRYIYIFSGRSDAVKEKTDRWLMHNNCFYDKLLMRPAGDYTPDDVLKKAWLEDVGKQRILFAVDDRAKVVKMWRDMGITCFQVAEGNF